MSAGGEASTQTAATAAGCCSLILKSPKPRRSFAIAKDLDGTGEGQGKGLTFTGGKTNTVLVQRIRSFVLHMANTDWILASHMVSGCLQECSHRAESHPFSGGKKE